MHTVVPRDSLDYTIKLGRSLFDSITKKVDCYSYVASLRIYTGAHTHTQKNKSSCSSTLTVSPACCLSIRCSADWGINQYVFPGIIWD